MLPNRPGFYRSLFPHAYGGTWRLPEIRIMAPMWSFGFLPETIDDATDVSDMTGLSRAFAEAMWTMQEAREAVPAKDGIKKWHEPRLMTVRVAEVASRVPINTSPGNEHNYKRLSLLALETIPKSGKVRDWHDIPVKHGTPVGPENGPLIVAPFDLPKPDPKYLARKGQKQQLMPPLVLLRGHVEIDANTDYLFHARAEMGLDAPDFSASAELEALKNRLYLLPDGFAISGAIILPWSATKVSGWFKLCDRNPDPEKGKPSEQVMRPWQGDGIAGIAPHLAKGWDAAMAELTEGLGRIETANPAWLRLSLNDRIEPEDLFWPNANDGSSFLFKHVPDAKLLAVSLENRGIAARLAYRPGGDVPLTTLGVEPPAFKVTKAPQGIEVSGSVGKQTKGLEGTYRYRPGDADAREKLALSEDKKPITLAVPMVETAEQLRADTGLDTPPLEQSPGLLWTFTPIEGGWLHWPLPNATNAVLNRLTGAASAPVRAGVKSAERPSGAFALANRPELAGARADQHPWSLSLSECDYGKLRIVIDTNGLKWKIVEADVDLSGGEIEVDGLVPIVPFRQEETQLLPDHAERALRRRSLRAVSPGLLRGIERRLWDKGAGAKATARVELTLENFAIRADEAGHPDPAMQGIPRVKTTIRSGVAKTDKLLNAALRPWLWLRHATLPSIQSLPLALAGEAQRAPSGSRELAPFSRRDDISQGHTVFAFRNQVKKSAFGHDIDLSKSTVPIYIDTPYRRATEDAGWIDEIGMAVLTLPSLTLFPGLSTPQNKGRLKAARVADWPDPQRWNGLRTGIEFELRHDMALRDEAYAFATLPPKEEAEESEEDVAQEPPAAPPPMFFSPRSDNGPQGGEEPETVWADLWLRMNRLAALAATDDRTLVKPAKGKPAAVLLSGVFGEEDFAYSSISIRPETAIRSGSGGDPAAGGDPVPRLDHIGKMTLTGSPRIDMPGLPDEGDLIGLNASFKRKADKRDVQVRFGTATLTPKDGSFRDQRGLATEGKPAGLPDEEGDGFVLRKGRTSGKNGKAFALVTLQSPAKFGTGLRFWCADVPFDADGKGLLGASAAKMPENSAAYDQNHLSGFRWALESDGNEGLIPIDGLMFEPLRLVEANLDKPISDKSTRPQSFVIEGHLRLPLDRANPEKAPVAGGLARLSVTLVKAGGASHVLTARGLKWPLVAPDVENATPVPMLEIDTWPATGSGSNGTLRFLLGGVPYALAIKARASGGDVECTWQRGSAAPPGMLALVGAKVKLVNETGVLSPGEASVTLQARLKSGEAASQVAKAPRLVADLAISVPLSGGDPSLVPGASLILEGDGGKDVTLPIAESAPPELAEEVRSRSLWFDGRAFGVAWEIPMGGKKASPLFGAFDVQAGEGAYFTVLRHDGKANGDFRVLDVRAFGQLSLAARSLQSDDALDVTLDLVIEDDATRAAERGDFRLIGRMALSNLFRFPKVKLGKIASLTDWKAADFKDAAGTKSQILHEADAIFDGPSVASADLGPDKPLTLAASVEHRLSDGKQTLAWRVFQAVRMTPLKVFRAGLAASLADLAKPNAKERSAGALHLIDPALTRAKTALFGRLYHPFGAHHAAVAGDLAKAWLDETEDARQALVVDVSGHHVLEWRDGGKDRRVAVLPLACFGALGPATGEGDLFDEAGSEALRLMRSHAPTGKTRKVCVPTVESPLVAEAQIGLSHRAEARAEAKLHAADEAARRDARDLASAVLFPEGVKDDPQQTVFQSFAVIGDPPDKASAPYKLAALTLPAAPMSVAISEVLAAEPGKAGTVTAMSFAAAGALRQPGLASAYNEENYKKAMDKFRQVARDEAIASPDRLAPPATAAKGPRRATLYVAGQAAATVQLLGRLQDSGSTDTDFVIWATTTIARLAPWAKAALLEVTSGAGVTDLRTLVPTSLEREARPSLPSPPLRAESPEGQRVPGRGFSASHMPGAVASGYAPRQAGAVLVASDPVTGTAPGQSTDGPRLTATATDAAWTLDQASAPFLGKELAEAESDAFWVASRMQVAYRPATTMAKTKDRLTFALPTGFQEAIPHGLLPAVRSETCGAEPDEAGMRQAFAPGYVGMGRVSPRAGVWANERLGLSVATKDSGVALAGSEVPLHLRTPRPPILARNDRPRASAYELPHVALASDPQAILHGPRRHRQGTTLTPTGLDRRPRSAWASIIRLAEPARGLLTRDWDGRLRLGEDMTIYEGVPEDVLWRLEEAVLRFAGQTFRAGKSEVDGERPLDKISGLENLVLSQFKDQSGTFAEEALRFQPPATPVALEIELLETKGALRRKLRFDLFAAGRGMNLTEPPIFIRFDDPEYNDRLDGLAKINSNKLLSNALEITFAADRPDVRPSDRIEFAIGLRSEIDAPVTGDNGFTSGPDNVLFLDNEAVELRLQLERSGVKDALTLGVPNKDGVDAPVALEYKGAPNFAAFSLPCAYLVQLEPKTVTLPSAQPLLRPGDRLTLHILRKNIELVRLSFSVVSRPLLPLNPAGFAFLKLGYQGIKTPDASVAAPLYAPGPPAAEIELVDPKDLLDGFVRRRALYQWRLFDEDPRAEASRIYRYALQKINAVGGSWLPRDLDEGWQGREADQDG